MPLIVDLVCVILIFVVFYFAIKKQAKDEGHTSVTAEILDEAQSGKSGFKDSKGNELSKQDASHQATVYFLMYPFIMIGVIFIGLDVYTRFTAGIEIRLIYVGCLVATFLIYKIGFRNSKKQPNLQSHSSEVPPVKTPTSLSTNVPLSRNQVLTWRAYPIIDSWISCIGD